MKRPPGKGRPLYLTVPIMRALAIADQFGMCSVSLTNSIRSVAGGFEAMGGTLVAVMAGATHGYGGPQRGIVRTTCDGGNGVPLVK